MKPLTERHIQAGSGGDLALGLTYHWRGGATLKQFLRDVSTQNPNRDDQARAFFAIGLKAKQVATAEDVAEPERNKASAESTMAFKSIEKKYADRKYGDRTFGSMARGQLAGLKNAGKLSSSFALLEGSDPG